MKGHPSQSLKKFSFLNGANAAFIDHEYTRYLADPDSVEGSWRLFFEGYEFGKADSGDRGTEGGAVASKIESYINLIRRMGHLSAHLNPLAEKPGLLDELLPENHGLADVSDEQVVQPANIPHAGLLKWGEVKSLLYATYCESIGADFRDIPSVEGVQWFQNEMESCLNRPTLSTKEKKRILSRLISSEGFEKFLGDRFLGQKRFSLEGLEALIPLLDFMTQDANEAGVDEVCIGMAHRGRLNVLANYMGKPYELMLKEFEGSEYTTHDIDGDVKYHMGFANYIEGLGGAKLRAYLLPNPSHLEAVNPVVEGFVRARQRILGDSQRSKVLPVLIHGDASFIGQGIVSETLNLSELDSYMTGGTIHVITNNQIGFTSNTYESRSCPHASDIAKIVRAPVLHVNADDPEAVVWAGELAVKYRQKFHRDIVIDLIGYRRHGHNETDEPTFTQPYMYRKIKSHQSVLSLYSAKLVGEGVVSASEVEAEKKEFRKGLQDALNRVRSGKLEVILPTPKELSLDSKVLKVTDEDLFKPVDTRVPQARLEKVGSAISSVPRSFAIHPKISKLFGNRQKMIADGRIDWGLAELLAFATLADEGFHVRLSGQDCQRGTFSHRHAVLKNQDSGSHLHILNQIQGQKAEVSVINSPLSEAGVLGFEFGYSVANRNSLVIWEAQFGDFSNGAQIIIDQFLAASEAKWKQVSGLVLLLPHGYEGMGPEHSSARPERFLQLCGNNNLQVACLTTPAQLFHVLRRQVLREFRKPLVIMSPKSLLRHPKVVSNMDDFTAGGFSELLDDNEIKHADKVKRLVFCTGKIFYELDEARVKNNVDDVAIVRVEQLYPFPEKQIESLIKKYSKVEEVLWTQEEPSNMGYWTFVRHRIKKYALRSARFRYSGRKSAGTTAEGSLKSHQNEQQRIIFDALGLSCPINADLESGSKRGS